MDLSILLPTYCEVGNISHLITAIEANLTPLHRQVEILVVDDNSPDGTAAAVQQLIPLPGFTIRCLVRTQERGLASAIKYGILNACGNEILVMDTDFNHSPDNLPLMLQTLQDHDLVIGSRFVKGGGMEDRGRYLGSLLFNLFIRLVLWNPIHDNLCGFFAMRRGTLLQMDLDSIFSGYGEYFIRLIFFARKKGLKIQEIPVFYTLRTSGESKSNFLSMIVNYTGTTLRLFFKR
jgi:dolichol-phosphate mannosyltransferase